LTKTILTIKIKDMMISSVSCGSFRVAHNYWLSTKNLRLSAA